MNMIYGYLMLMSSLEPKIGEDQKKFILTSIISISPNPEEQDVIRHDYNDETLLAVASMRPVDIRFDDLAVMTLSSSRIMLLLDKRCSLAIARFASSSWSLNIFSS